MSICCKCGADFDLFEDRPRGPNRVCKECLVSELAIQDEIAHFGLVALAKRYVPDATICLAGLARWRSASDIVSGFVGRAVAGAVAGGAGAMLTTGFKPGPAGLVALTATELITVELKTLGNPADSFNYLDLAELNLPEHYCQDTSIIRAKVKRYALTDKTRADFTRADEMTVIAVTGDVFLTVEFPDSYHPANAATAESIASYITTRGTLEQQLNYSDLSNSEVERSAVPQLRTKPCRGCGREVPFSAIRDKCSHCGYTARYQLWGCAIFSLLPFGLCFLYGKQIASDFTPGVLWVVFWGAVTVLCLQWAGRKAFRNMQLTRSIRSVGQGSPPKPGAA
jgi:hypothetical protein